MSDMSGQSMDPVDAYTQMELAQRAAIAEEFIERFRRLDVATS